MDNYLLTMLEKNNLTWLGKETKYHSEMITILEQGPSNMVI